MWRSWQTSSSARCRPTRWAWAAACRSTPRSDGRAGEGAFFVRFATTPPVQSGPEEATDEPSCLGDLEWPLLLEVFAARTVSALGREEVLALQPATAREQARLRQATLGELLELASLDARLPVGDVQDTSDTLERVRRGGIASGPELALVLRVLRTSLGLLR